MKAFPWLGAATVAAALAIWQVAAVSGAWPEHVLPGPRAVAAALGGGILSGKFITAASVSLERLALGYGIASTTGVMLGIAMGSSPTLNQMFGALIASLQPLPSICWLPLALIWFGLNDSAIVFVVVLATLGTVALAVRDAVLQVPKLWVRAARNMGLSGMALWRRVLFPAALPGTLSGLRVGWSYAWRALMAGELLFVAGGLGQVMHVGREINDMAQVVATMVMIVILGLAFDSGLLGKLERAVRRKRGLTR